MKRSKKASKTVPKEPPPPVGASGLRVPEQRQVSLTEVNEAAYNPRVMPPEKMVALKASLMKHGLVLNLVVQKKGMVLIGGHQRVRAMRALCEEHGWPLPATVPATVLDVSDSEAKQLNVGLNNIEGEFDPFKLGELFAGIRADMTMDDVIATGFEAENIDEVIRLTLPPPPDVTDDGSNQINEFGRSITMSVEFDTVERRDEAKAYLKEHGGKKPGVLLLKALKAAVAAGKVNGRGRKTSVEGATAEA